MAIIWSNVVTTPQRLVAKWLRRKGWVCFYLDEQARHCSASCWLELYQAEEARTVGAVAGTGEVL